MPRVLGVHGIAQQYKSGPELTRAWSDALRGGLEAAGFRPTADGLSESDVRVAFFGDLFRPPGVMAGSGPPFSADDVRPGPERELLGQFYAAAVDQDPSLGPPPEPMGAGKAAVQTMLNRLLRSPTFAHVAQRALIGDLKQVTEFLHVPAVKERVLERINGELKPATTVIVGHSLGSVIVYEYLAKYRPAQVELPVTLGSPLGIPNLIFEQLTPPPAGNVGCWPGQVARWVNVADPNDVVALRKHLALLFAALDGGTGVEDHLVANGNEPHAITRYLNAKPTGSALGALL